MRKGLVAFGETRKAGGLYQGVALGADAVSEIREVLAGSREDPFAQRASIVL